MEIKNIESVYFIGIGGIGMSALARYFHRLGKKVAGYDKTSSALTGELEQDGIEVNFQDNPAKLHAAFLNKEKTLVVVTPAIPVQHQEWIFFQRNGYRIKKRAEVLGLITKQTFCLAVAGTHGKTTTSSMLAHILYRAKLEVTSFLGGVLENYQSNLVGEGTKISVVEADEFDRSFLHLHPDVACILSNDADHLDIYQTDNQIKESFEAFAAKIVDKTKLFVAEGIQMKGITVGFSDKATIQAFNLGIEKGLRRFDLKINDEIIENILLMLPGNHNVLNASMAIAMAKTLGVSNAQIKDALIDFKGVRRRFSYKINEKNFVYIDDYAHHPTEIQAVFQAVKELYPSKEITVVFQPHLYTRTRDFMNEFARALSGFNKVILLEIYPAREEPILGIDSAKLLDKIDNANKILLAKEELLNYFKEYKTEVLVTLGAGDIGEMVEDIALVFEQRTN